MSAGGMLGQFLGRIRSDFVGTRGFTAAPSAPVVPPPIQAGAQPGPDTRRLALRDAFTHTRPQRSVTRFVGRQVQLDRILRALTVERAHVVLYGERGRGKTSLANIVAASLREQGYTLARHACTADSDFDSIIRGLARDLPHTFLAAHIGAALPYDAGKDGCERVLPAGRLQPADLAMLSGWLNGRQIVFMIDEFDRVADRGTRIRLADTIKQLSDQGVPLGFMVLGVSDSLEQLLGLHPSIQRNIVGIPLPLLSDAEIDDILLRGSAAARLELPAPARACIKALARGLPYLAHLLALHAGHAALDRQAPAVAGCDIVAAVALAVAEADPRIVAMADVLMDGGRDLAMAALLSAIAAGQQDAYGRFRVTTGPRRELRVAGRAADPLTWQRLVEAGAVRACAGAAPSLHVMSEPTLLSYVLLKRVRDAGAPD